MTNKCFIAYSKKVDALLNNLSQKYALYCNLTERKIAEDKSNSISWGGYQELQYIQKFNNDICKDVYELVDKIEMLTNDINRKLKKKQLNIITEKIAKEIENTVSKFKSSYANSMSGINRTIETYLSLMPGNIINVVNSRFSLFQFKSKFTRDKALLLSIIGNIISIISLLTTIIINYIG